MIRTLTDDQLIDSLRALVAKCNRTEAEILVHIQEVEARHLHLERAHSSIFSFCTSELGYSEDAAYNRIEVARAAVRFPAMLDALASGRIHLTGLRLLAPHITPENHLDVLARAAKKTKRQIEELVATLAPKPAVPDSIRKLPQAIPAPPPLPLPVSAPQAVPPSPAPQAVSTSLHVPAAATPPERRPVVAPLAEDAFRVQFTANRALKDKLREAQDLLRHQLPDGDLAQVVERALDLLIASEKKRRFGVGATPKKAPLKSPRPSSRHIPASVRREVFERDGHRCTFVDAHGRRCEETAGLELDHLDGFARVGVHDPARIRIRCKAHNQHAADKMYGRAFMLRARNRRLSSRDDLTDERTPRMEARPTTLDAPTP